MKLPKMKKPSMMVSRYCLFFRIMTPKEGHKNIKGALPFRVESRMMSWVNC